LEGEVEMSGCVCRRGLEGSSKTQKLRKKTKNQLTSKREIEKLLA
jgi:hypothetical protein